MDEHLHSKEIIYISVFHGIFMASAAEMMMYMSEHGFKILLLSHAIRNIHFKGFSNRNVKMFGGCVLAVFRTKDAADLSI